MVGSDNKASRTRRLELEGHAVGDLGSGLTGIATAPNSHDADSHTREWSSMSLERAVNVQL